MSKKVNWLITDNNITVNYEGQTHIVSRTDALADHLIKAVKEQRLNEIPNLISAAKRIESYSKGNFVVKDGDIFVNGVKAPSALGNKIVKFSNEGLPFSPLVKFAEKLQKNPSFRAVNELFQFLEKNDHPVTEDGNFIAYKKVRPDFKDIHSGTFDNSPGVTVEMSRNEVNENPNETCSNGLHIANWDYAAHHFGSPSDTMLEVEIDPSDVVSVPVDYDRAKMRVCKYKVLGVVDRAHSTDVSIRVTGSSSVSELRDQEMEECSSDCVKCRDSECDECGEVDCDEYDCRYKCTNCGISKDDDGYDLCFECEPDELDPEKEDKYPWEDEV